MYRERYHIEELHEILRPPEDDEPYVDLRKKVDRLESLGFWDSAVWPEEFRESRPYTKVVLEGPNASGKSFLGRTLGELMTYMDGAVYGRGEQLREGEGLPIYIVQQEPPSIHVDAELRLALSQYGIQGDAGSTFRTLCKSGLPDPLQQLLFFMLSRNRQDAGMVNFFQRTRGRLDVPYSRFAHLHHVGLRGYAKGMGQPDYAAAALLRDEQTHPVCSISDRNWFSSMVYQGYQLAVRAHRIDPSRDFYAHFSNWVRDILDAHQYLEERGFLLPTTGIIVVLPMNAIASHPRLQIASDKEGKTRDNAGVDEADRYEVILAAQEDLWLYGNVVDILRGTITVPSVPRSIVLLNDVTGNGTTMSDVAILAGSLIANFTRYGRDAHEFVVPDTWTNLVPLVGQDIRSLDSAPAQPLPDPTENEIFDALRRIYWTQPELAVGRQAFPPVLRHVQRNWAEYGLR